MHALDVFAALLLERLAWTSLQATVLIGAVAAVIHWLPRLSAATRCLLWWLVGLQLLLGLAWPAPIALPLAPPAPAVVSTVANAPMPAGRDARTFVPPIAALPADTAPSLAAQFVQAARQHARSVVLGGWLLGLALSLMPLVTPWRRARAQRRQSTPASDPALLALYARRTRALGLGRPPALRICSAIDSPQVIGLWQPAVLLPDDHALSAGELAMALDHELAHLRRGDLWMAWVPALAQRLFFFHPLVRWAMREYALHREAACDAQVMQHARAAPQDYGRLLLRLGVSHPLHAGLAGASPTFENLKRRLLMLQHIEPSSRLRGWLLVAGIAAVGLLPYRVTTAATHVDPSPASTRATAAAPAPRPAPAAAALPAATTAVAARPMVAAPPAPPPPPRAPGELPPPPPPAPTALPPPPPAPPAPPPPPAMHGGMSAHHIDIDTHDHAANGFALFDGDSITMSGTDRDIEVARDLRKDDESLLWFRRGDRAYVIRDPAMLARAKALYAPVSELAREQGRLGGKQGELGGRQGGLGARQGDLGRRQAELARDQAIAELQSGRADQKAAWEERQRDLESQQQALAREQAALGEQQAELGKRQEQASALASRGMGKLLDEALAQGVAQPAAAR